MNVVRRLRAWVEECDLLWHDVLLIFAFICVVIVAIGWSMEVDR